MSVNYEQISLSYSQKIISPEPYPLLRELELKVYRESIININAPENTP